MTVDRDTSPSDEPAPGSPLGADWLRGLALPRVSRRAMLQAGGAAALAATLAACGVSGAKKSATSAAAPAGSARASATTSAVDAFWAAQKQTGSFNFANWPLYIDVNPKNKNDHPSLDLFTKQTGIKVNYSEVINDAGTFFGKIQPQLAAGAYCGYDLAVLTKAVYFENLMNLGYLVELDQSRMTNFNANAGPLVKHSSIDPHNQYSLPWQSGITGIAYNPKWTGRKITSWQDLQDPAFKGKVGMFGDVEDMPNSALCAIGVDPPTSTETDWKRAAAWLIKGRPLVRQYYYQDYISPLSRGDVWLSMAFSGDIFQANASGAQLEFVIPKEGAPFWTDCMFIPKYSKHPLDAMTYMDFVFRPEVAAMLAEYINYITPVPGCKSIIASDAAKASGDDKTSLESLVTSPLIFPTADEMSRLRYYRTLTEAEQKVWNGIFEPVYQR